MKPDGGGMSVGWGWADFCYSRQWQAKPPARPAKSRNPPRLLLLLLLPLRNRVDGRCDDVKEVLVEMYRGIVDISGVACPRQVGSRIDRLTAEKQL